MSHTIRRSIEGSDEVIGEIIELSRSIIKRPCCCSLCSPRIRILKELGGRVREGYSFLEARWTSDNGQVVIVPDDPGCFITRVIDGFGTILSCIGVEDKSFNAVIYDGKYNIVGKTRVDYRRTSSASYYYTRETLEEYKYVLIPSDILPRVEGHNIVGGTGFRDILAQAMGLYAALNYGYRLLIVYRSIITLGNELRVTAGSKPILIGSKELYDRVRELLEGRSIIYVQMKKKDEVGLDELLETIKVLEQKRQV